jgi:hypothetical protein
MSGKSASGGTSTISPKLLKGVTAANSLGLTAGDLASLLNGATLSNLNLLDASISGDTLDAVLVGSITPSAGVFTTLFVGVPGKSGAQFTLVGNAVDSSNNPVYKVSYDPVNGTFNIQGGLTVTGATQLGYIVIRDNDIVCVGGTGNINLIPQYNTNFINIAGNVQMTSTGSIDFGLASTFSVTSNTSNLISQNNTVLGTIDGTLLIQSDSTKIPVQIQSAIYNNTGSTITTVSNNNLVTGNVIIISGTGNIDGTWTVTNVISPRIFKIQVPFLFLTIFNTGTVTPERTGIINISAGNSVNFTDQVPLTFGDTGTYQPYIISQNSQDLDIQARYLRSLDPIPTLETISGSFSDSGIAVSYNVGNSTYSGFFGFIGSTQYFTWIPQATITLTPTGKSVSGIKGVMELAGLVTSSIIGDPNLTLSAPTGSVIFNTNQIVIPDNSHLNIGSSILTTNSFGNTSLTTTGNFTFNIPNANTINIPEGTSLSFFQSAGVTQSITGTNNGLVITSSPNPVIINGILNVTGLSFGTTGDSILTGPNNNLILNSTGGITFNPQTRLFLPENVFFQIGADTSTGLYGALGAIYWYSTTDYNIATGKYINLTSGSGKINLNSTGVYMQTTSELYIGLGSISSVNYNVVPGDTITINSSDILSLTSSVINLNATSSIDIPIDTLIKFGSSGNEIYSSSIDGLLHFQNGIVINGSLQVNGPSTYITSTSTSITDPVIFLAPELGVVDIKSRGLVYRWNSPGPHSHLGFIGFDQQNQVFMLSYDGSLLNDVYTSTQLGNLNLNGLNANNVTTESFTVSTVIGNPDLALQAGFIYLNATNSIQIPTGINIVSGSTTIGTSTNGNTLIITAPNVSFPDSLLTIGNTILNQTDLNNFHIGNIQNIYLDASVNIGQSLVFGNTGVSIIIDSFGNINFTSAYGGKVIFSGLALLNGGLGLGNSIMNWSNSNGGEIIWKNTTSNTDLNISILGNILDANWEGQPITIDYGGTGHNGSWTAKCIVFVGDTAVSLEDDPGQLVYDHISQCMGIRTALPTSTLSIGSGDIDLMNNTSNILFRSNTGLYNFSLGQVNKHLVVSGTSNYTNNSSLLNPYVIIDPFGQIGIGMPIAFMNALQGLSSEYLLYVNGSLKFNNPANGMYFSNTEYINGLNGSLNFYSANSIVFNANVLFSQYVSFLEFDSMIFGTAGGILNINSDYMTELNAPHVLVPNRLCLHHQGTLCQMYLTDTLGTLTINNLVGDILLNGLNNVIIPDSVNILLGTTGVINSTSGTLNVISTGGDIDLTGNNVNILNGSLMNFYAFPTASLIFSSIFQTSTSFNLVTNGPTIFNTSSITFPNSSTVYLGINGSISNTTSNVTFTSSGTSSSLSLASSYVNFLAGNKGVFYSADSSVFSTIQMTNSTFNFQTPTNLGIFLDTSFVNLPNSSSINLGTNASISNSTGNLSIYCNNSSIGDGTLNIYSSNVELYNGTKLSFYSPDNTIVSSLQQVSDSQFNFISSTAVYMTVPSVFLPDNSPINFGNSSSIHGTSDSLVITNLNLVTINSNNVHITGNLIVDQKTTFTIESETSFDSGIVILGQSQIYNIIALSSYFSTETLVTIDIVHYLVVGDQVTLYDTIPNIDGVYTILQVPSNQSFTISIVFPGYPVGATSPYGKVMSALTTDPGSDLGVIFKWNSGGLFPGTTNSKTGFFGFRRNTQCLVYIPDSTQVGNNYFGDLGSFCIGTVNASVGINTPALLGPLNTGNYLITGSNFVISGGIIDNTPIGTLVPNVGYFTNLTVTGLFIDNNSLIQNLNAQYLNGHPSSFFVTIDGNTMMVNNWNAGPYTITSGGFADTSLTVHDGIVFSGIGGILEQSSLFIYDSINNVLNVPNISTTSITNSSLFPTGFVIAGPNGLLQTSNLITFSGNTVTVPSLTTSNIQDTSLTGNGVVYCDLNGNLTTVNVFTYTTSTKILNVTNINATSIIASSIYSSLLFPTGIVFSGNSGLLINSSLFTFDGTGLLIPSLYGTTLNGTFNGQNTANLIGTNITIGSGVTFDASSGTIIFSNGQLSGNYLSGGTGNINITGQAGSVLNGIYTTNYTDNSVLVANTAGNPYPLTIPEGTVLGRLVGGNIEPITFAELSTVLDIPSDLANLYVPDSILFESTTGVIQPLVVPFDTFIGRGNSGEITALTISEMRTLLDINNVVITEQVLNDAGAVLKSGNSVFPTGGTMTGLLFTACERITIVTGQTLDLGPNVENSYISVNYSIPGGRFGTLTLGNGIADGQRRSVIMSSMDEFSVLKLDLNSVASDGSNPSSIIFVSNGQSIFLIWDNVQSIWNILNSGASALYSEELNDPEWVSRVTGELND